MLIGYARVSTREQETYLQLDALRKAGAQSIYQEKASSVGARPQLQVALGKLQDGDVLIVYKFDRVARSLKDLLDILERVKAAGASVRSLTEPLDTTGPLGQFMLQVLGAFAQLERSMIRERAIAGQVAARMRGVSWGGGRAAFSADESEAVYMMRKDGWPVLLLAEMFEVAPSTISRVTMRRDSPHLGQFRKLRVLGPYLEGASA
ncbi:MAG: resolvase [Rhodoferax sp.]|nr:resolvase [Rhodoferax sp.]